MLILAFDCYFTLMHYVNFLGSVSKMFGLVSLGYSFRSLDSPNPLNTPPRGKYPEKKPKPKKWKIKLTKFKSGLIPLNHLTLGFMINVDGQNRQDK